MKLETKEKTFEPFTITIETPEEAYELLLRYMCDPEEISSLYTIYRDSIKVLLESTGRKNYDCINREVQRQGLTKYKSYYRNY